MESGTVTQKRPAKKKIKTSWSKHQPRWFGKWHIYLGIIAGFIIAVISITGSILVFEDGIDEALNKDLFLVQQAQHKIPLVDIVLMVQQKYPALQFEYAMDEADKPNSAYRFYNFTAKEEFFINPYTAALSGRRLYESSFIRIVTSIHTSLCIGQTGTYITGIASLILLILTITGLRLWIPQKWSQLKQMLTVKFSAGFRRQNYDWHNVIGFYTAPVVSLLSLTGFCITFSLVIIPLLFMLSGKPPQEVVKIFSAKSAYKKGARPLSLQQAAVIAQQKMPGGRIVLVGLPADSSGVYAFTMYVPGLPKGGHREMIYIDQYNGSPTLNSRTDFPDIGKAYLAWLTPIHFGSFGGLPTQILAVIGGAAPLALFISGFIIWYPRWRKQKRSAEKKAAKGNFNKEDMPVRHAAAKEETRLGTAAFFAKQLKQSFKYAVWILLICAVMGALYGVVSGIVIQPAVFTIAYTAVLIIINFLIAMLCMLFNIIFLGPFKKGSRMLVKYFALSSGFFIVFTVVYMLLMNTGLKIF
ncbi:PepSY-associated TM helix domain-containing protein [Parafilimonas sp.]|uniref:PepSY-associated TM helix domain-containing protein n=1 Tax=Parafilimonas sp. TaxID=1969739 RepID=UPI0039E5A9DB